MTTTIQPTTTSSEDHDVNVGFDAASAFVAFILASQHGIPVFPVDPDNSPQRVGVIDATTDHATIVSWFTDRPDFQVGAVIDDDGGDGYVVVPSVITIPDDPHKWLADLADADKAVFDYISLADLHRKDITNPGWIVQRIWPGDAYGTLAAESKAGKTWSQLDLAVSVATGGNWLNAYQCDKGTVVVFLGEGGERNTRRRLRAICKHKGVDPDSLDNLLIVDRVPHFNDNLSMGLFRRTLRHIDPRLVIVDPLYFAAAGGEGSNLYSMGDLLEQAQHAVAAVDAALVVVHHFNQTGSGNSARRMTGAGPEEWSRVLGAAGHKELTSTQHGGSRVQVDWTFTGGEIAPQKLSVIRTVWVDDPNDLTSPMHYHIEVTEGADTASSLTPAQQAVLDVLDEGWMTATEIYELVTASGTIIARDTVTTKLRQLGDSIEKTGPGNNPTYRKAQ